MVNSKYLTHPMDWDERIRVLEDNLSNCYYDFVYFNISLNLIDAIDNADYDKEQVLRKMLDAYKRRAFKSIQTQINKLKELV